MSTSKAKGSVSSRVPWHRFRVWWRSNHGWALAGVVALVLVLGTYGAHQYLVENHQPARLSDSLYMALQCFWVSSPAEGGRTGYPIAYQIARFLGPFVLIYAAIYTLFRVFRRQIDRFTVKWHRDHLVICGFGLQGQALAEVALKHNMKVAVVDQDVDLHEEAVRKIRELGGVPILVGDARKPETLRSAGVHKAQQVVVLCGSDEVNGQVVAAIEVAMESLELRRSKLRVALQNVRKAFKSPTRSKLKVTVQVMDIELCERLELNELRFGPRNRSIDIDFECLPDLAAKYILRRFHLPEPRAEWPTVVIVGAGLMAEAMLISVAQKVFFHQFDLPPLVVVADKGSDAMVERVLHRHPRIATLLDVRPESSRACASYVRNGDEIVYICLDDETRGVALGLSLQLAQIRPHRTVVQTWGRHSLLDVTARSPAGTGSLVHVSILEAMEDIDTVLASVREQFARAIHEHYQQGRFKTNDGGKDWVRLETEFKNQNRDQAATFEKKLNDIDAYIVPLLLVEESPRQFSDEEIEELAKMEHERWMEHKRADGYVGPGDKVRKRKAKIHPDLVEFKELPEHEKDKDRDAIRNMPNVLKQANYGIVWRENPKVSSDDRDKVDFVS